MEVHLRTELSLWKGEEIAPPPRTKPSCDIENPLQPLWIASVIFSITYTSPSPQLRLQDFVLFGWVFMGFFWLRVFLRKSPKLWPSAMLHSATPSPTPAPLPALCLYILAFIFLSFTSSIHYILFLSYTHNFISCHQAKRFSAGDWKGSCPFSMLYWLSKHNSWILLE